MRQYVHKIAIYGGGTCIYFTNREKFEKIPWQCERDMVYYISCQRGGDAEREAEKSQKTFAKPLDKRLKIWYNIKVSQKRPNGLKRPKRKSKRVRKKLKKLLQNLLTNASRYDIIYKSRVSDSKGKRKNPLTGMVLENWTARDWKKSTVRYAD